MAYQDPYYTAGQYSHSGQQYYGQPQYAPQQQYGDAAPPGAFNPYISGQQPHQSYDYGGYRDEPAQDQQQHEQDQYAAPPRVPAKSIDETSRFDPGEFSPAPRGPKTAGNLRRYRMEFQGNLWAKGGRGRCFGRFFLALWIRPPSVNIGTVAPTTSGSTIVPTTDGVTINMGVNISVNNPNYFAVTFKKIQADISYPLDGNTTAIGNGTANHIVIASNDQTNFTFPFAIDYSTSIDPNSKILADIVEKCAILGGTKSNLVVDYKITLGIQFLFITISPSVSNSFSFACPLTESDLSGLLDGISSLVGGS